MTDHTVDKACELLASDIETVIAALATIRKGENP